MEKRKMPSTAVLTFAAMILGSILGLIFGEQMCTYKFIGTIWLNCIKMIQIPLIVCILVTAVGKQGNLSDFGRVAVRIMIYYVVTTICAIIIGLGVTSVIKPGTWVNLEGMEVTEIGDTVSMSIPTFFTNMFPDNMFKAFVNADVLGTMVISIMLGVAILKMSNETYKNVVLSWFEGMNNLVTEYLRIVISLSPVGVLFLMGDSFGKYGMAIFSSMAGLLATHWISLICQILLVYCLFLMIFAHMNPFTFLKKAMPVWTFTLATCSSTANIPVGLKTAKENFNVPDRIAAFSIPLGASMNSDGMAIGFSTVFLFIAQMNGVQFGIAELLRMIIVATLLSSAGSGIPGGGIVKIATVVSTFGLPIEIVGIMAGFYRLFDMGTTTCNCLGDLVGTVVVSHMEDKREQKTAQQHS